MKPIVLGLTILLAVALEVSFMGALRPLGVLPNLVLVVLIYAGLICTVSEAVAMALLGGLCLDLVSGSDFGLRMAFYSLFVLMVILIKRAGADFDNIGLILACTVGGTLLYNLVVLAGLAVIHVPLSVGVVMSVLVRETGLNLVIVFLTGPVLTRLFRSGRQLAGAGSKLL